jgi:type II secretory pathway pseudopilin PulG
MKINKLQKNKGFTLVEALFAIFILTFSISTFMGVVSNNLFSARYARDEISANYLLQEVVDYIRNDRDTNVFLQSGDVKEAWSAFSDKYNVCLERNGGCYIDVQADSGPKSCISDSRDPGAQTPLEEDGSGADTRIDPNLKNDGCPTLYFNPKALTGSFYNYTRGAEGNVEGKFTRNIFVTPNKSNGDQLDVNVSVTWNNGSLPRTRTLKTSILRWQQ